MRNSLFIPICLAVLLPMTTNALNLEFVTVGDPGNEGDTKVMRLSGTTGYGAVSETYRIGKYEVTNAQYAAFLNAVAATDTNALYNPAPGRSLQAAASRGVSGRGLESIIGDGTLF